MRTQLLNSPASLAVLAFLLVAGAVPSVTAQSRVGTTAAPFLTLGAGARGQALGHAYTAAATGGDALFWNPAGAARPSGTFRGNLFATNQQWLADIAYNALGITLPVGAQTLGLSIATVDYGEMERTDESNQEDTGLQFTAADLSLGLTYARPLTESFYFGGTAKYVRQRIWDMSAQTLAFDFGFVLETDYLNGMTIAASIQNFGGKMRMAGVNAFIPVDPDENIDSNNDNIPAYYEMGRWDLPLSFRFGMALPVVRTSNIELLALADANQSNDNNLNSDLGAQLRFRTSVLTFDARAGYKDLFLEEDAVDSHFTYGAGVDVRISPVRLGIDFAYTPFERLGSTQMVDLRISF